MSPRHPLRELIAGPDDAGRRLDKVLRAALRGEPLSEIYAALRKGRIRVNDRKAEPELRVEEGDRIALPDSLFPAASPERGESPAEGLAGIRDILILASPDLIFVNKPRGVLSQGDEGLEGRIRLALAGRSQASLSFVPGPLHRLDRNTTGIMTFPRSAEGARAFAAAMRGRSIRKRYLALVDGEADRAEAWRDRLVRDGRTMTSSVAEGGVEVGAEAYAEMRPLVAGRERSLVLVELHSGLTHQIRVQAAARRMPLSGDSKYGGKPFAGGYILHALSLGLPSPPFDDLPAQVLAELPEDALRRLASLFGQEALRAALASAAGTDQAS